MPNNCIVENCEEKHAAKGYCSKHYVRFRRNGNPLVVKNIHGDDQERFLSYCEMDESIGCLVWTGTKNPNGYGQICINGKTVYTHRYSYEFYHGPIPLTLQVHHSCNRGHLSCVDPRHLVVGTHRQNMEHMVHSDRSLKGEKHHGARLNEYKVHQIRRVMKKRPSDVSETKWMKRLAGVYKVSWQTIYSVVIGNTWSHLPYEE